MWGVGKINKPVMGQENRRLEEWTTIKIFPILTLKKIIIISCPLIDVNQYVLLIVLPCWDLYLYFLIND